MNVSKRLWFVLMELVYILPLSEIVSIVSVFSPWVFEMCVYLNMMISSSLSCLLLYCCRQMLQWSCRGWSPLLTALRRWARDQCRSEFRRLVVVSNRVCIKRWFWNKTGYILLFYNAVQCEWTFRVNIHVFVCFFFFFTLIRITVVASFLWGANTLTCSKIKECY